MIALLSTLLIAIYILGPDFFSRWLLGFVVQRKSLTQSKSEQIVHGVIWAIIPLTIAWYLRHIGPFSVPSGTTLDMRTFFGGLYSDAFFNKNQDQFYTACNVFFQFNLCLLTRLYTVVLLSSLIVNWLIGIYGPVRNRLIKKNADSSNKAAKSWILPVLSTLVLPRISEWHLILSPIMLQSKDMIIALDVLTKSDFHYSGLLSDKVIGSDGNLQSLTLANPKRFRRIQYLEDQKQNKNVKLESYWKPVPGNLFVIMASEIATLNVRHLPGNVGPFSKEYKDIAEALNQIRTRVLSLDPNTNIEATPETNAETTN